MARTLTGTVVSAKPDKTITVAIKSRVVHPIYRKAFNRTKKIAAHDPENTFKEGDTVTVTETRPLSARKRFIVVTDAKAAEKKAAEK